MQHEFYQVRAWAMNPSVREYGKKVGLIGGLLLSGWLGGSLLVGAVQYPTDLNAAIGETAEVSSQDNSDLNKQGGFAEIAKAVRPAVVHMTVVRDMKDSPFHNPSESLRDFWGRDSFPFPNPPRDFKDPRGIGMGSGVIVSPMGYVVTNHHVVEGANTVSVRLLDKREFTGKVIGSDPQTDLAVIKIDGENLPYLEWGNSQNLQVGDYVLAVGNPFGLTSTVTQGIVSALGRGGMGITQYEDFIQTDAAINPGNSGGALVNVRGELVGINTAIFSRNGGYQGVGFSVPSDMAQSVYSSVVKNGKVVRGYLGIGIQEITPELAETFGLEKPEGALVTDVKSGSPAQKAGIKRGDTIVKYQGVSISDPRSLQKQVLRTPVGSSVSLVVVGDNGEQKLQATIQELSKNKRLVQANSEMSEQGFSGVSVMPLEPSAGHRLGTKTLDHGVVVKDVEPGSPADRAGLARGDVIREVNRQEIKTLDDYYQAAESLEENQRALLFVDRSGVPLFLTIKS